MKKILSILALCALVVSCTPDNGGNNDTLNRTVLTFEGDYWNSLIDNPQYGGELLYSATPYFWYDEATDLEHQASNTEWSGAYYPSAWMGVSNYHSADYASFATSQSQLTVYASAMHSGNNCIVCNGYKSTWGDSRPAISFRDGATIVESVWVANTTYLCGEALLDGGFAPKLTSESVWVRATGYTIDDIGNEVEGSSLDFYLFVEGKLAFSEWKEWRLTALGKVDKVKFDVQWNGVGGADNLLLPAYFALDDITVVKE
jgi:hypothetical protein